MVMPEEYSQRDFAQGPRTYTDSAFLDTIFIATKLAEFKGSALVVDFMSGPGKVASGIKERVSGHRYVALDGSVGLLRKIADPEIERVVGDIRATPLKPNSVDIGIVRYGIKDIPEEQQLDVLRQIYESLKPGGKLVIADMVSPEGAREWNNKQHSQKQQFSGRNIETEGECNIPTENEWLTLLREIGFETEVFGYYTSYVTTTDWVNGRQITDKQRQLMDKLLLNTPDEIKTAFNIRQEEEDVRIDYPVIIIKAVKPKTESGGVYVAE